MIQDLEIFVHDERERIGQVMAAYQRAHHATVLQADRTADDTEKAAVGSMDGVADEHAQRALRRQERLAHPWLLH
ncbi:hypothetical protein D9M71_499610 [compost metagenome]